VVDLLTLEDSEMSQSQTLSETGISTSQVDGKGTKIGGNEKPSADFSTSNKAYTSREVHDKLHYSTLSLVPSRKPRSELLDHVMLRRALDGYLFDCKINKTVATHDQWLQNLWEWIQGKISRVLDYYMPNIHPGAEEAAQDDRMVSRPLDLSYMGVYTLWMNLLGETTAWFCLFLLTTR
jgi:hypothetical protein